jgi:hypothetical protein
MKKKPVERNQRRLQPTFRGEREGSDRRWPKNELEEEEGDREDIEL